MAKLYHSTLSFNNDYVTGIWIQGNPKITELDFLDSPNLLGAIVVDNENLVSINLIGNALESAIIMNNESLSALNMSNNALTDVLIADNPWLEYLDISYNELVTLDLTGQVGFNSINLSHNRLEVLNLYAGLTELRTLYLNDNQLNDVQYLEYIAESLVILDIQNNPLTSALLNSFIYYPYSMLDDLKY